VPDEPELDNFNKLWKARLSFWLDQHLANSVVNLSDSSLGNYKEYIEHVNALENVDLQQKKETLCFLYSEQHYCQIHFYKYEDAEQSINKAKEIALLPLELTGRMGKRTKYQIQNIAQLTLDLSKEQVNLEIKPENSEVTTGDKKEEEGTDGYWAESHNEPEIKNAQNVNLDQDTIIHD
jgi:hypothetical protein